MYERQTLSIKVGDQNYSMSLAYRTCWSYRKSLTLVCCGYPFLAAAQSSPQVVVVNPGRLAKGGSGGTYAHVTVAAGTSSISSRCRVDIVRV